MISDFEIDFLVLHPTKVVDAKYLCFSDGPKAGEN